MQVRHAAVVYNPVKVRLGELRRAVQRHESSAGWAPSRWYETAADDSGREAVEDALAGEPAVLIVAGGDGTVRVACAAAHPLGVPVALVPAGTGNLLARNLGVPLNDVLGAVAVAFTGTVREVDVAVALLEDGEGGRRTETFMVMAGIGLDAEMADSTSAWAKKRMGWVAYVPPIARSIGAHRLFRLHYRVDRGRTRSASAHTVIVGNCGTLTGNMLLIPAARVDDGLLDVVLLSPKGRFGWAGIGARLAAQRFARASRLGARLLELAPDVQALNYAQGQQFDVRFDTPHAVELDGDRFGLVARARITVRPSALKLCVSAQAHGPETETAAP